MSPAFIKGVGEHLPNARITLDKFRPRLAVSLYREQLRDILDHKQISVVSALEQWCSNVMRSKVEPMKEVAQSAGISTASSPGGARGSAGIREKFLIARDDTLWQLPTTKFQQMLREPANHCLSTFAGQRARMADVVVELVAREPVRVVRTTFSILTFDGEGRLDPGAFERQQFALAESVVAPVFAASADESKQPVVDASARFIAQGGQ